MYDQLLQCRDCKQEFVFTRDEQSFYSERNLSAPQRCSNCRAKRKADRWASRSMFDTTCAQCGNLCQVPFQPRPVEEGGRHVLCLNCFEKCRATGVSVQDVYKANYQSAAQSEPSVQKGQAVILPSIVIRSLLFFSDRTKEGQLVEGVSIAWFEILEQISRDPDIVYKLSYRDWEEIIAGAYKRDGWDEVILTPRSADKGRDVVATKYGVGTIRFFDQVKAYRKHRAVTAEEVRAMLGVITGAANVSKGIITTTSCFAPRVGDDEYIRPYLPYRLELRPCGVLLQWLSTLANGTKQHDAETKAALPEDSCRHAFVIKERDETGDTRTTPEDYK